MIFDIRKHINDGWGGIDKKIEGIVVALNALKIPTTGSCEGHINRDAPAPWIKITSQNEPKNIKTESIASQQRRKENSRIRKKVLKLLNRFYKDRRVSFDLRLRITDANVGFWIHNGGKFYDQWRKEINVRAKNIEREISTENILSAKEKLERKKKLPLYQKEIQKFTNFLENQTRIGKQ